MAESKGDPRVLFVMNLVLSTLFAAAVVWGLSVVGELAFTARNVVVAAAAIAVVTWLVTR